jgi:hypothetical protein
MLYMRYPDAEKHREKALPQMLVPKDTRNLARGKAVTTSDKDIETESLEAVNDADKTTRIELAPGRQWIQIDLQEICEIYAIAVWHDPMGPTIVHDVIIQVANEPDFLEPRTLFNNDRDGSSGYGIGTDREYVESNYGKVIDAKDVRARYVRLHSRNAANLNGGDLDGNAYAEVEVYGVPVR